ncbi:MAG: aldehyde dehydrogenase family protein, partial [Rhodobacteraceae bacterium]|nr:aldehyde dehydrogenase family protein [Paracoccaceae bacterium]
KPSEQTPLSALRLARILAEELPPGVVNVIPGRGESVGNTLIKHAGVDMISLTGDVATGKKMLQAAAKSVKRTHLELGGKAPVIVFDDADIDAVVAGLQAFGYYNAGQDCTAASRVYAGARIYDRLVADLSTAVSGIRLGLDDDTENEIGPLISQRQRDRVASFVERARELGHVEITTGGSSLGDNGFYYAPTVVAG